MHPVFVQELEMALEDPPVCPEKHAWLEWDGDPSHPPTASGHMIPATSVESSSITGGPLWMGWEAHIRLETGATAVLWAQSTGWNEHYHRWQWTGPSLNTHLFSDGERLCLAEKAGKLHLHQGCLGLEDVGAHYTSRNLYADEDLWMYLKRWSTMPIVGRERISQ